MTMLLIMVLLMDALLAWGMPRRVQSASMQMPELRLLMFPEDYGFALLGP
jgi:hypothetical protein